MPKEVVRPEGEHCNTVAIVGWSREDAGGHVQLGTVRDQTEASYDPSNGLYITLDRRSINDLIRHLRRARDQAFGRDE